MVLWLTMAFLVWRREMPKVSPPTVILLLLMMTLLAETSTLALTL